MYESFFGLSERPFMAAPRQDHYFPAPTAERARTTLLRVVARDEGPALLMGGSGLGKSLLTSVICDQLEDHFKIAHWADGHLTTRHGLLQAVLYSLGQPHREMDEGELRLALIDYLRHSDECPRGILLVVDEAHRLPGRLLEELRMIGDVLRDGQPCVRLLLVGTMALEERFTHPRLEAFSQRLAARCYLEAFTCPDTVEFLQTRLEACGVVAEDVFTDEALEAIHTAADGNPRAVSQLADHALVLGYQDNRRVIDEAYVQEVWADLQQLPVSWQGTGVGASGTDAGESSGGGSAAGVIEFGSLDDEPAVIEARTPTAVIAPIEATAPTPVGDEQPSTSHEDVFGADFDEEIDIVDRYVSLDAGGWSDLPQVTSDEGAEMASMLGTARDVADGEAEPATHLQIAADTSPDGVETDDVSAPLADEPVIVPDDDGVAVDQEPLRLLLVDTAAETDSVDEATPAATLVRGDGLADAFHRLRRG